MEDFTCLPPPGGCGWRKHNNTDYVVGRPKNGTIFGEIANGTIFGEIANGPDGIAIVFNGTQT